MTATIRPASVAHTPAPCARRTGGTAATTSAASTATPSQVSSLDLLPGWRRASLSQPVTGRVNPLYRRNDVTTRTRSRKLALAAVTVALALTGTAAPATAATGDPQPDDTMTPMIIGGSPASPVYQGLGSLQYQRGDDPSWHTCAVNLWTPWHAVTNAHCVTSYPDGMPYDPARYKIRFNSTDRLAGGVVGSCPLILDT
jgi:hypothetical protein